MDEAERRQRTATLAGARDDARAQAVSTGDPERSTGRVLPAGEAARAAGLPEGVEASSVRWAETIGAGGYAARRLARDTVLRIDDLEGDACVQLLAFSAANTAERLNVADTVKVQWQAYPGEGALLLSDLGRVLLTIVADTSGGHDCLCGGSNRRGNDERYGDGSVSGPAPNARDLLVLGAMKQGLTRRDVGPCINLFRSVAVDEDGGLRLLDRSGPASVELRAELDVVVVVANTPHPLDDRPTYAAGPVRLTAWSAERPADDPWRATSPERLRAFLNTEDHVLELAR
jgi:urea carboxylase-associated protein 2